MFPAVHLNPARTSFRVATTSSGSTGYRLRQLALAKAPLTAADLLNDRVVPFYDQHEVKLSRMLADRDTEFCANPERHGYELYLAVEDVDHSRTKTRNPHTNGIAE